MSNWPEAQAEYARLIESPDQDSRYLRERGLIPNVLNLLGPCAEATVLDAGTGTGWLFENVRPKEAHAVDLVQPKQLPDWVEFRKGEVSDLPYEDNSFDSIVASMLLMFCPGLVAVLSEFYRVCAPNGALVVALTHPYFYRTGKVMKDGNFLLERTLSTEHNFDIRIGETVGPFRYYYRPLPVYYNSLLQTNWGIEETKDWFIEEEDYACFLKAGGQSKLCRSAAIPLYTFIRARK